MMYLGDFPADQAVYFMWNTNDGDGGSITRSGDGTISVYKDNSDGSSFDQTQSTTGITNDEDVDALTGVHSCCITTTNAWYETGHDYTVVLSASTIDTQTVNAVLAHFSIENRFMRGTESAYTGTPPTVTQIRTEMEGAGTKLTLTLEDTAEIGAAGAGLSDLGGMSTGMKTEVNDEVLDVMKTDTTSEMSQGAPPETPTMEQMQAYIYFMVRNKNVETSTEHAVYDNLGSTKLFKAAIADNGTTLTKDEYVSGV